MLLFSFASFTLLNARHSLSAALGASCWLLASVWFLLPSAILKCPLLLTVILLLFAFHNIVSALFSVATATLSFFCVLLFVFLFLCFMWHNGSFACILITFVAVIFIVPTRVKVVYNIRHTYVCMCVYAVLLLLLYCSCASVHAYDYK